MSKLKTIIQTLFTPQESPLERYCRLLEDKWTKQILEDKGFKVKK